MHCQSLTECDMVMEVERESRIYQKLKNKHIILHQFNLVSVCLCREFFVFAILFSPWIRSMILDRSLMIGWRKNSWNPERVSSVFIFVSVCLHAGYRAHLLTYELNFWVKWSLGHDEKTIFFCFSKYSCLRFLLAFVDFVLI